jgi:hypothetical protein
VRYDIEKARCMNLVIRSCSSQIRLKTDVIIHMHVQLKVLFEIEFQLVFDLIWVLDPKRPL